MATYMTGDTSISVCIGEQVLEDVHLSDLASVSTGQACRDVVFDDLVVASGQFSRYQADDNQISGAFYGPNHEEVGGVFDDPHGLVGSYGAVRDSGSN